MEAELIDRFARSGWTYFKIEDVNSLRKIYNLYMLGQHVDPETPVEYNYYGLYYKYIRPDYQRMKTYYLAAIDGGNSWAMHNLAYYYRTIEVDRQQMKRYYLMSIDKGLMQTMRALAHYYQVDEVDHEQMVKYYKMAIEHGCQISIRELGTYYREAGDWVEALMVYLRNPREFSPAISQIVVENSEMVRTMLGQSQQLQDAIRALKLKVKDLKYRPVPPGYEKCRQRFEANRKRMVRRNSI